MSKCFCHLNGYEVKDAAARRELEGVSARVNNLVANTGEQTEGNAELIDIRVGVNGVNYETAGEAVRGQYSELKTVLNDISEFKIVSDNKFDNVYGTSGFIDTTTGEITMNPSWKCTSKFYEIDSDGESNYINTAVSKAFNGIGVVVYDGDKNVVKYIPLNNITSGGAGVANAKYFRVYTKADFDGLVYVSRKKEGNPVDFSYVEKYCLKTDNSNFKKNLKGKVIVNFGDSLFGNFRDSSSISARLSELSGATVHDCSFGGCKMANQHKNAGSDDAWNAFSMHSLADSIAANDFSLQERYSTYDGGEGGQGVLSYFPETVQLLKSIDFSKVDMITIAYGTNDYTDDTPIPLNDTENGFDCDTFIGALKYSLRKILGAYPNIRILVITPTWRYFEDGTDSDVKSFGSGTLPEYITALKAECSKSRVPLLNSYEELTLNRYNSDYFMVDGVHLNEKGRLMYAELINGKINSLMC